MVEAGLLEENLEEIAQAVPDAQRLELLEGRHRLGAAAGAVEIVMFTDYQCPDCRRLESDVARLLDEQPDVSLVVKHFPFCAACNAHTARTVHPNACWAARAAEAAAILGGMEGFERMHAWLFENKGSFTDATFPDDLRALGFEPGEFIRTMTSDETLSRVRGDTDDARDLGVFFTPMVFINGVEYTWYYAGNGTIEAAITAARNRPRRLPMTAVEKLVEDWSNQRRRTLSGTDERTPLGSGPVEVTVFGDYHSEATVKLDKAVRSLIDEGRTVSYHYRHYPIDPACNELAERYGQVNAGACDDARLVEATELLHGPERRWSLHERLIEAGPNVDRSIILAELDLDEAELRSVASSERRIEARLSRDVSEKMAVWRMHAPILLIDGRFVPRWQHDDIEPAPLIARMLDTIDHGVSAP